jgi:hypothetical protein
LEYLEALKLADAMTVPSDQSDDVRQLYEPLIEDLQNKTDDSAAQRLCENISKLLLRVTGSTDDRINTWHGDLPVLWRSSCKPNLAPCSGANRVSEYARQGLMRTAMDEAFDAIRSAPTYLPLHTLMGDLLVKEGRSADAIAKFSVVAHAYGMRGEVGQATRLLRRVIQLAPMDMAARTLLIDQLTARGRS